MNKYFDLVWPVLPSSNGELDKLKRCMVATCLRERRSCEQKIRQYFPEDPDQPMYGLTAAKFGNRANGNLVRTTRTTLWQSAVRCSWFG